MRRLTRRGTRWSERGSTAVEYALIAALIALVIIGVVTVFGQRTNDLFEKSCQSFPNSSSC
ncbi:MAG: Flp family type IVb pilin [Nocardioidaceae bacterium]|nr:Flp family type IVb pilin [Nocardioidaceae bacterium]